MHKEGFSTCQLSMMESSLITTITCKAEYTEVRMGLAAVTLRIHHHGYHKTQHHHNGVPGGADEPDSLVQNGKTAARQPVSQPLN